MRCGMKIIACIKQVPNTTEIKIDGEEFLIARQGDILALVEE